MLRVYELLTCIFQHLSKRSDRVSCALVNRTWCEAALDVIWYEVDDLRLLFNALSPVKHWPGPDRNKVCVFDRQPNPRDWSRFELKYSLRVRVLYGPSDPDEINRSSPLGVVLRIRPTSKPIFPNLRFLSWNANRGDFDDAFVFMHEGVSKCTLIANGNYRFSPETLCHVIHSRMPFLTHLSVDMFPHVEYLEPLVDLVKNLPNLTSVELPPFREVSKILPTIFNLTHLKAMRFKVGDDVARFNKDIISVTDIGPHMDLLNPKPSPLNLQDVELYCASYGSVLGFFQFSGLIHLHEITLVSEVIEKPPAVRNLFRTISRNCRRITKLSVTYMRALHRRILGEDDFPSPTSGDIVSFDDICDILVCTEIVSLVFVHPYGLDVTDLDAEKMAAAFPKLKKADIGSYPACRIVRAMIRSPSLRSFFIFADKCPFIEEIHLLVNTAISFPPPTITHVSRTLRVVGVGLSEIHGRDEYSIALLLSQICGPDCTLIYDPTNLSKRLEQEELRDKWETVKKLLPLANGLRARVAEIMEEKEREIRSLKELLLVRDMTSST
ncbi:hypothetical protein K435DRAFT_302095 [Dendrothele bispora CBS 962.96]|uniref:F-box domain-containing protein n=1 Tax=Dendrothele bispora (strain CBS 962.96) TaxID=1314807 RepID=A0A4S8LJ78_DENBC|nr:hypothetical protein K435DRAFT_302095 [Dendrothele bispora CBS 962.96]